MQGRKPKPTHLKVIQGNPGKRPLNKKEPMPITDELPSAPEFICAEAKTEWKRVAGILHAIGMLTTLDRAALAVYCQAVGRWERAELALEKMAATDPSTQALLIKTKSGNLIQNPLVGTANKAMFAVLKSAAELGLTPSVRSRIEISDAAKSRLTNPVPNSAAEFFSA